MRKPLSATERAAGSHRQLFFLGKRGADGDGDDCQDGDYSFVHGHLSIIISKSKGFRLNM